MASPAAQPVVFAPGSSGQAGSAGSVPSVQVGFSTAAPPPPPPGAPPRGSVMQELGGQDWSEQLYDHVMAHIPCVTEELHEFIVNYFIESSGAQGSSSGKALTSGSLGSLM